MMQIHCEAHPRAELIVDSRAGDLICPECGLVVGDRIVDVGTEWRSFNNEKSQKDPSRVGAAENPLLSGSDLGTTIIGLGSDYGLRNLQRKTMNAQDRQLTTAFGVIKDMADRKHMPSCVVEQAKLIYKNGIDSGALKNKNTNAAAAAALYIACRKEEVPRTFKEIASLAGVTVKELGKAYKAIINNSTPLNLSSVNAVDHVNRFVNNLALEHNVKAELNTLASRIIKRAVQLDICTGRSPISIAAAGIYLACTKLSISMSPKDIGDVCGAAEVTVKQTYRMMQPRIEQLVADEKSTNASTSAQS